jgi:membrane protease subunit HflK
MQKLFFKSLLALFFKSPWDQNNSPKNGNQDAQENIFLRKRSQSPFFNFEINFKLIVYLILAAFALWLCSGFYEVNEGQESVVTRFGKFIRKDGPGLNYRLPYPIDNFYIENVNKSRRVEVGYRSNSSSSNENPNESIMLTGDENIVKLHCDVMWHISDLKNFMFNVYDPEYTIRTVAQSVIREVISCTPVFNVLSDQKQQIADHIQTLIQSILDSYDIGIKIEQVQLLKVEPPEQVIAAYRDVQTAKSDKESSINQAQAYSNDIIPNAAGKAAEMLQQAEGYKQEAVSRAEGDVKRFDAVYSQYCQNKQITKDRLMLDVVEEVMSGAAKTIANDGIMLPHMQLKQH